MINLYSKSCIYRVKNSIIAPVSLKRNTLKIHRRNLSPFIGSPIWASVRIYIKSFIKTNEIDKKIKIEIKNKQNMKTSSITIKIYQLRRNMIFNKLYLN